jgi:hypothetical protein
MCVVAYVFGFGVRGEVGVEPVYRREMEVLEDAIEVVREWWWLIRRLTPR